MRTFAQKPKATQQTKPTESAKGSQTLSGQRRDHSILQLERAIANQAVQRLLRTNSESVEVEPSVQGTARFGHDFSQIPVHATKPIAIQQKVSAASPHKHERGGLRPEVRDDVDVGGRTLGEFIGDVWRPIGTGVGNVIGSIAGAVTGISVSSNTTTAPAWHNHGHFRWEVGFTTTGRNGWIVQEVESTRRAQDAAGNALPDGLTRHYWEAWAVNGAGNVSPAVGGTNDTWQRRSWGNNTQGHWSMRGRVHFTPTNPATQGFAAGTVPEAGILLSTTIAPAGLGIARLHRYAQGTWDSTGAAPTHTGSAGP